MNNETVQLEIAKERSKIAQMANRITMKFDKKIVDVDIAKQWQWVAPSVESIECALNDSDCTVINVRFGPGGIVRRHRHDRQEEIFVVAGEIHDTISGVTTKQGDRYIIPKDTSHEIVSDYARLTVVFRPPFPKVEIETQ